MNKRILLFDIDGTLTRSVKTVEEDVFQKALGEIYGKKIEKKDIVYSGGTDRLIWKWLLEREIE
jgi:beta-phosphoglucomutase-like phosphatase (HAD superfamily)